MANLEHVEIVRQGAQSIKAWKAKNIGVRLDLDSANLRELKLDNADLRNMSFRGAFLRRATFRGARLYDVDFTNANLSMADFTEAACTGVSFSNANLINATLLSVHAETVQFDRADLTDGILADSRFVASDFSNANLGGADVGSARFESSILRGTKLSESLFDRTVFVDMDLSVAIGLNETIHSGPSSIGVDTLFKSQGNISEEFLRKCGIPHSLITYLPSFVGSMDPIQFQSCFISYSTHDDEFARRLHSRMRENNLRVWFAPEDISGGKKIIDQLDRAIQVNDRLLLVLSEFSLKSDWVKHEVIRARRTEKLENRQKLFPIRLVDIKKLQKWQCVDFETGEDIAAEIRSYHIPDFSNWKDHDSFEAAFKKLMDDLKKAAG